ncbi:DUF4123 domain-containing protein [Vreelandella sp. EE27]
MSSWLKEISARSQPCKRPATSEKTWWLILDQRRDPARCAAWLNQPGRNEFMTLFAGTPLAPLIEASPWLVEVVPGSPAAREAEAFCHRQLGWIATAKPGATLKSMADHLGTLFVLSDPHGGQSLINLQKPAAWTALLASADPVTWRHLVAPFSALYIPTAEGSWRKWPAPEELAGDPPLIRLDRVTEQALKESSRAWWLSAATGTPMEALPDHWLARLAALNSARITRGSHLLRLLPLIQREAPLTPQEQATLAMDAPARKKTNALENVA